jgi:parallel beta-helix repeat protein
LIIDGAGYTLSGPYNGSQANVWVVGNGPNQSPDLIAQYIIGIDLGAPTVEGIMIQNLNVKNFSIGMYMWTKNNTITGNSITESILGILLSGSNTTITNNYLAKNTQGLFFGFNGDEELIPADILISHNGFDNNTFQINGCFCEEYPENEPPHAWDNGREGNYWSATTARMLTAMEQVTHHTLLTSKIRTDIVMKNYPSRLFHKKIFSKP